MNLGFKSNGNSEFDNDREDKKNNKKIEERIEEFVADHGRDVDIGDMIIIIFVCVVCFAFVILGTILSI